MGDQGGVRPSNGGMDMNLEWQKVPSRLNWWAAYHNGQLVGRVVEFAGVWVGEWQNAPDNWGAGEYASFDDAKAAVEERAGMEEVR